MNNGGGNGAGCFEVNVWADAGKFTNVIVAIKTYRKCSDLVPEVGLKQQLSKTQDCYLTTTHSARNFGFIFDEHLTFSDQITALSKSCY